MEHNASMQPDWESQELGLNTRRPHIQPIPGIRYQPEPHINSYDYLQLLYLTGVIEKYRNSEVEVITAMIKNSLIITARQDALLVAAARYVTDYINTTFVAELLVREDFRRAGIGMDLIKEIHKLHPNTNVCFSPTDMFNEYIPLGLEVVKFNAVLPSTV